MVDLATITYEVLGNFWQAFLNFVPRLILALIVLLVGWLIAEGVGRLVHEILKRLQLDKLAQMKRWGRSLEKADLKATLSAFIGSVCKWILVIVVLWIMAEVLLPPSSGFADFLHRIVDWLPNLVAAVFIFVATVICAGLAEKIVRAGVEGAQVGYAKLVSAIIKWAIWIFGISAILLQLGIAEELILVFFQGVVALVAIAGGLAFGLGGKEVAADCWRSLRENFSK